MAPWCGEVARAARDGRLRRARDRQTTDNAAPSLFDPIHHASARKPDGLGRAAGADQCLTRDEALACASREGAHLTFEEDVKGTLAVGKLADIAVLDQDLLTAPEDAIPGIRADLVVVGGAVVLETPPRWAAWPRGRP